jgi:heat shock protein HslJ
MKSILALHQICTIKTQYMKLTAFISTGAFILFSAFVLKKDDQPETFLYNTRRVLKKVFTAEGGELVQTKAFIQLNAEKKTAGGNGSCNSFGSSVVTAGNHISFASIFSTKMYCEGIQKTADVFFQQLGKANMFEIKGNRLLLYRGKKLLLEFVSN